MSYNYINTTVEDLFVFDYIFINDESFWDTFLRKIELNFEKQKEVQWNDHWQKHAENEILSKWKIKYRDYLIEPSNEVKDSIENQCLDDIDEQKQSKTWQDLWNEHCEEIYWKRYYIFDSIYYNYISDLKEYIENKTEHLDDHIELESLEIELKEIELLGLPTSFRSKKQTKSKSEVNLKNLNWFFVGDEDEINMNSLKLNKKGSENLISDILKSSIKQKKKNRKLRNIPKFFLEEKGMIKYWRKRFSLFTRFDKGIKLDRESWFSVTPEKVAKHLAEKLSCELIIDGFCGCGGNAIQFAKTCKKVIAIDIDPIKIQMAKHNAAIYKVADKIEFVVADFIQIIESGRIQSDVVFMSPPWGGPNYKEEAVYDIEHSLSPVSASELINKTKKICDNIALFLPRNSNLKQIVKLAGIGNRCEILHSYLNSRLVGVTAIYGENIIEKRSLNIKVNCTD